MYNKSNYKKISKEDYDKKNKEYEKEVADLFIKAIQENKAPWQQSWKPEINAYEFNPTTRGKEEFSEKGIYKGINQLYLNLSRKLILNSEDPRWMTFVQMQDLNKNIKNPNDKLFIKKGSKATTIKFYSPLYLDENNKVIKDPANFIDAKKTFPILKSYFVFNSSQIVKYKYDEKGNVLKDKEGNDITEPGLAPLPESKKYFMPLIEPEKLVENTHVVVKNDQVDRCFYSSTTDEIHTAPKKNFKTNNDYYSVLLHELTHWSGDKRRLNREESKNYNIDKKWRAKEELIAEIGSYMLCKDCKLQFNPTKNNVAYVQSWCEALNNKPEAIFEACKKAKSAADYIHGCSLKNEVQINQEKKETEVQTFTITKKKTNSR